MARIIRNAQPTPLTKADRIRMTQPWRKERRPLTLATVLKFAAAIVALFIVAHLALDAAQPDGYAGTFRLVRVIYGQEVTIDRGISGRDCAERIATMTAATCQAE